MKLTFLLLSFFTCIHVSAQVRIAGKVTDNKNKPLAGVSIMLANTYDGATSDSLGNFSFTSSEQGEQDFVTSISGYNTYEKKILLSGGELRIDVSLKELITELNAVVISAGSFEAGDKKKGTVLTSLDVVTTAGANGDITGALKTLPGTQQVGESEGLFVRGGTATESKIFMDGNLVNNFFYSSLPGIATRGRFNPFLFKGTVFSAGGYSALYGQALSSALILESTDLPEKTEASLSLSVIGIGGGIQKLAKSKRSSWGITYSYANLALAFGVIRQKQDFYKIPQYHELDANFRIRTRAGGMIKYYGYASYNRTAFRADDIDSSALRNAFQLENLNTYQNLNWRENIGRGWKSIASLSYSTNKDDISNELQDATNQKVPVNTASDYAFKNFNLKNRSDYAQARIVLEKRLAGINTLRIGAEHFYSRETSAYRLYTGETYKDTIRDNLTAAFAETDIYITKDIAAKIGTRGEYSSLMNRFNLAPRISLAYKLANKSQVSFAYGIFYQNPERKYLPALNNDPGFAKATHYIVQYEIVKNDRRFRSEIFYKQYNNLFKTKANGYGVEVADNNNGKGYAKGLELFWRDKKSFKGVDYWVSYSYLDTKRDYLNFPGSMRPNFAATHTASLVIKNFVLPIKTGFNLSYNFASGRPYYHLKYDDAQQKYYIADKGNTINYNSLAFSLNYLPNLGKAGNKGYIVWVLSVSNVLGQKQIYGYNYASLTDRKVAVTPPAPRFIYIGCFLSFGVDRTQDAINNNL